ncbi:MAG: DinB family protein [Ilumatobacteraceae bacterium]
MDVSQLLLELFGRIPPLVADAAGGLDAEQLVERPGDGANTVGWLLWHLARVQDDHVAEILGEEQIWVSGDWPARFGLAPDPSNTGYGHSEDEVMSVRPTETDAITGYLDAVQQRTEAMLRRLTPEELDRVVDDDWDPPVTLGVRLISIADDSLQHVGQAAFIRRLVGG